MTDKKTLQLEIFETARDGKLLKIRELIAQGVNPFSLDQDGRSAISYISDINQADTKLLAKELARFLYTNKMEK